MKWIQFELMSPNTIPDNVLKIFVKSIKFVSMSQNMYNSERCSESFVKANKFRLIISNDVLKIFVKLNKYTWIWERQCEFENVNVNSRMSKCWSHIKIFQRNGHSPLSKVDSDWKTNISDQLTAGNLKSRPLIGWRFSWQFSKQ